MCVYQNRCLGSIYYIVIAYLILASFQKCVLRFSKSFLENFKPVEMWQEVYTLYLVSLVLNTFFICFISYINV